MKILITGSNGFIGKNVTEQLSDKHDFLKVSHSKVDLTDYSLVSPFFEEFKPDAVIHCAAKPGHRLAKDLNNIALVNLQMFTCINKCVKDFKVKKFISIGSGSEFSMDRNIDNISENSSGEVIPKDETGFSRYIMNSLISQTEGGVNLRCFGVFGKYEDYNLRFISNCIVKAMFNKDIVLNENKEFSYLYIDDLVKIIDIFLYSSPKFSDYNITPDYILSIAEIAELVKEITKSESRIKIIKNGFNYTGSNLRLKKEFDYNFTPFKSAVEDLYKYYLSVKNQLIIT